MKHIKYTTVVLCVLSLMLLLVPAMAAPAGTPVKGNGRKVGPVTYKPGEVIVIWKDGTSAAVKARVKSSAGVKGTLTKAGGRAKTNRELLKLAPGASTEAAVGKLRKSPAVKAAGLNRLMKLDYTPPSPDFPKQWGLNNTGQMVGQYPMPGTPGADIDATKAWDIEKGNSNATTVAVIDSGIDLNHPNLKDRLWTNSADPVDGVDNDHNGYIDDYNGYNWAGISNYGMNNGREFGKDGNSRFAAQKFRAQGINGKCPVAGLEMLFYGKVGTPTQTITYAIRSSLSGANIVATNPISPASIPAGEVSFVDEPFKSVYNLTPGKDYYFVVYTSATDASNYYYIVDNSSAQDSYVEDSYVEGSEWWNRGGVWTEYPDDDFYFKSTGYYYNRDNMGHGTHCCGIVGAAEKSTGSVGVAFGNATRIMALKAGDSSGELWSSDWMDAVDYASSMGADIISMSVGLSGYDPVEQAVITNAYNNGLTLFASVGNSGRHAISYPAAYEHVIGVGATDNRDYKAFFSTYNSSVDLSAPGVDIYSTMPTYPVTMNREYARNYDFLSGTSMACPMAAGVAALVRSQNPAYTPAQIQNCLQSTADDLGDTGRDDYFGFGRVNAYRAVSTVLTAPMNVGVNPTTNRIYVANYASKSVSVRDGATDTVIKTVPVGTNPCAVSVNSTTNKVYVANYGSNSVSVIDGASNLVVATPTVGASPIAVGVNPNPTNNKVYVANYESNTVSVIDGATNGVVATVPVGTLPHAVGVNPTTNKVYVANRGSRSVSVIDGATNGVVATVAVGASPIAVGVNPNTGKVYVANSGSNNVSVINGADNSVATVPAGASPIAVGVNPTNNKVYVANLYSNNVSVINGADNSVATVPVGSFPIAVGVNPTTGKIYVANAGSNNVTVISGRTNKWLANVNVGTFPYAVGVNPTTNKVYVANLYSNDVSVINGADNSVATVPVGTNPCAVGVNPTTNKVYVANMGSNSVSVIDGTTNGVVATPTVGNNPCAVGVNPNPTINKVYVANSGGNTVSVINGATNGVVNVPVGTSPVAVGVNPNPTNNKVYVANSGSNDVSVINGATNSVVANVAVGNNPCAVGVNLQTNKVYVANQGRFWLVSWTDWGFTPSSVSVIDGTSNQVVATLNVGTQPRAVGVNPTTNRVYVVNSSSNSVSVIDGSTDTVVATVPVGSLPWAVAVNPNTGKVYVANFYGRSVSVIDGTSNQVVATVPMRSYPPDVGVNPTTNKVYVVNYVLSGGLGGPGGIVGIDGATNSVVATVPVGTIPCAVGVNPTTNEVYVVNSWSNSVSVIDCNE
jgi:YVTN family beta-propeller protein